ncbi:MAG: T9SS type A sorting domain-containing protein, partial [Flavobacteriales bacterium]|nr:T9SS type A sorting domain-containing protein [Flavobacteriales bacterium]
PPATCTATKAIGDFNSARSNRASAVGSIEGPGTLNNINNNISHLKVYPNPSNGDFKIELNFIQSETATIEVLDITGKLLFRRIIQGNGIMLETVRLNYLNAGVYVLNVKTNSGIISQKILIK